MRIELGNPAPRSPATIVLSPGSAGTQAPEALRPINSPAAGQAAPVKLPATKDDQKQPHGLWQRTSEASPFLKPVTYLTDPAAHAANDSSYRLQPIAPPRIDEPASPPQPAEPRLLPNPAPLEISNPYATAK